MTLEGELRSYPWRDAVVTEDDHGTLSGSSATIDVTANDHFATDTAGGGISVHVIVQPSHGQVTYSSGQYTYTLTDPNFHGIDTFQYRIWYNSNKSNSDARLGQWDIATVEVKVP